MIIEEEVRSKPRPLISMPRLLAIGLSTRTVVDTSVQIFGPFLELIARGMGISIVTLGWLNSLRNMMGLAIPFVGVLADRIGYRAVMRISLWMGGGGLLLFAIGQQLWVYALGMIVMGLGLLSFVPVFQAYLSARVPYNRRAQALGIVEYGWALAGIVGLSLSGLLIQEFGWRAPFLMLGTVVLLVSFLFGALPSAAEQRLAEGPRVQSTVEGNPWQRLVGFLRLASNNRSTWSALFATGLNAFATSHVGIVYGSWLNREYGLSAVELGSVALLFGIIDLIGSVLVSLLADRLGKYRTLLTSTCAVFLAYALLPILNATLVQALAGLVWVRFTFEIAMVSSISLLSEQVPQQRARVMTLMAACITVAVAFSSITGPYAYSRWGVLGLSVGSATAALVAALLLALWVREPAMGAQSDG